MRSGNGTEHRSLAFLGRGEPPTKRGCAECGKAERPWRKMMWYPFQGCPGGAFICTDKCWDRFDER